MQYLLEISKDSITHNVRYSFKEKQSTKKWSSPFITEDPKEFFEALITVARIPLENHPSLKICPYCQSRL